MTQDVYVTVVFIVENEQDADDAIRRIRVPKYQEDEEVRIQSITAGYFKVVDPTDGH
jgi:hypothetical protein